MSNPTKICKSNEQGQKNPLIFCQEAKAEHPDWFAMDHGPDHTGDALQQTQQGGAINHLLLQCNLTTFRWPSAIKTFTRAAAASRRTFEASQTKFEASEKSARANLKKAELSEKLSVEAMRKSELQSEMCFVLRSKCFRR